MTKQELTRKYSKNQDLERLNKNDNKSLFGLIHMRGILHTILRQKDIAIKKYF